MCITGCCYRCLLCPQLRRGVCPLMQISKRVQPPPFLPLPRRSTCCGTATMRRGTLPAISSRRCAGGRGCSVQPMHALAAHVVPECVPALHCIIRRRCARMPGHALPAAQPTPLVECRPFAPAPCHRMQRGAPRRADCGPVPHTHPGSPGGAGAGEALVCFTCRVKCWMTCHVARMEVASKLGSGLGSC